MCFTLLLEVRLTFDFINEIFKAADGPLTSIKLYRNLLLREVQFIKETVIKITDQSEGWAGKTQATAL